MIKSVQSYKRITLLSYHHILFSVRFYYKFVFFNSYKFGNCISRCNKISLSYREDNSVYYRQCKRYLHCHCRALTLYTFNVEHAADLLDILYYNIHTDSSSGILCNFLLRRKSRCSYKIEYLFLCQIFFGFISKKSVCFCLLKNFTLFKTFTII